MAGYDDPRSMDGPGEPIAYAEARADLALAGIRAISGRAILPPSSSLMCSDRNGTCERGEKCDCNI